MEERDININAIDGIVALPIKEYSRLVRASERMDVVEAIYKSVSSSYERDSAIRAVFSLCQEVNDDE